MSKIHLSLFVSSINQVLRPRMFIERMLTVDGCCVCVVVMGKNKKEEKIRSPR